MSDRKADYHETIRDPFTQKADDYARMISGNASDQSLRILLERLPISRADAVLDAACGPGLLAAALAGVAGRVIGIDLTPEMILKARELQAQKGLANLEWVVGDATKLPFQDGCFEWVVSRFSLHHFQKPVALVKEMMRVLKPNGGLAVIDPATKEENNEAFNFMEKLRDPSHVRALTVSELRDLGKKIKLRNISLDFYGLEMELESQLTASRSQPGNIEKIRELFNENLRFDKLGVQARLAGGLIYFNYPVAVLTGFKEIK